MISVRSFEERKRSMLSKEVARRIAQACVTVRKGDCTGHGALIGGGFILTAAHCVTYPATEFEWGALPLDDLFAEIDTAAGVIRVRWLAVEPVHDIAILGALDDQEAWR